MHSFFYFATCICGANSSQYFLLMLLTNFISNIRGDSVLILVWIIKLLKLLRKLCRNQKNLI